MGYGSRRLAFQVSMNSRSTKRVAAIVVLCREGIGCVNAFLSSGEGLSAVNQ